MFHQFDLEILIKSFVHKKKIMERLLDDVCICLFQLLKGEESLFTQTERIESIRK